jgi:hypothetical protein
LATPALGYHRRETISFWLSIVSAHLQHLHHLPLTGAAFQVNDYIDAISDGGFDRFVQKIHPSLKNQRRKFIQSLCGRTSVASRKRTSIPRIEHDQELESSSISNLTQNQTIGPAAHWSSHQVSHANVWAAVLWAPRFEANQILVLQAYLGRVLSDHHSLVAVKCLAKRIQKPSLPELFEPLMRMFLRLRTSATRMSAISWLSMPDDGTQKNRHRTITGWTLISGSCPFANLWA